MLHLKRMRTADFLLQKINGQLIRTFLIGTQVDDVWSMNNNLLHTVLLHRLLSFSGIHGFNRLAARILRRPRIYHK
ncbi:hypothetical protein D3C73_1586590 [compost metagenome]